MMLRKEVTTLAVLGLAAVAGALAVSTRDGRVSVRGRPGTPQPAPAPRMNVTDVARLEFAWRRESYVTGRPDLSGWWDADYERHVQEHAARYITASGLRAEDAHDLLIARRPVALLLRFTLSPPHLSRFLRGKRRLPGSGRDLVAQVLDEGSVVSSTGGATVVTNFSCIFEYPFTRLTWWPPSPTVAAACEAYEGQATWRIHDAPAGVRYYILASRTTGTVHLLGY